MEVIDGSDLQPSAPCQSPVHAEHSTADGDSSTDGRSRSAGPSFAVIRLAP